MSKAFWRVATGTIALMGALAAPAAAQTRPSGVVATGETPEETVEVVAVGSNIRGKVTTSVPVVVLSAEQIDAVGAVNGDDLFRSIPQMGDVTFNANNNAQTSNAARGDVNSINLRSLGVGNTLVLVNGRRIVTHAASQGLSDTGTVPVLSYNSNAIPVTGVRRLEVLLDGAAALYGSDAVAGVANTVTRTNFDGLQASLQYGGAQGTDLRELQANLLAGRKFERGSITASLEYTKREALRSEDQPFTATADLRSFFANEPNFATSTTPDTRATRGLWPSLQTPTANGTIRRGTTALTSSAGAFQIRPANLGGCAITRPGDTCIATGALSTTGAFRNVRYDTARGVTTMPEVQRTNLFVTGHYDLGPNLTAYTELGYYTADTSRVQPPVINLNAIWIPASNHWNPFGPTTFANGQANPNRIAGLTNVPAAGLPVRLTNYRFVDAGPQTVDVENLQTRFLAGLRGEFRGFDWDSAIWFSEAEATDRSFAVRSSALQRSLALSTPDAYNPFNGGCVNDPTFGDCTPSSPAAIDAIGFTLQRKSRTTLTMADLRLSNRALFTIPGGDVGVAAGLEARRETQSDDRDRAVDESSPFVDAVTGEVTLSDAAAVSNNPDTKGDRTVGAAYLEFAIPIVSPEMKIPLVRSLDVQVAGRYENYSDFGSVSRPKVAVAWDLFEGLRVRGSYSEGFRAPNLEQTNAQQYSRAASGQDLYRCEADLRARRIANFTACGRNFNFSRVVSGNPDLQPEESTNSSFGFVFDPDFLPKELGRMTFTVDRWQIQQEGIVGIVGNEAAIALDYQLRLQGSSNPNVIRAAANADDQTVFAGTGMQSAGVILSVRDRFINLLPQTVSGVDFGFLWSLNDTPIGKFEFTLNATNLTEYEREPGAVVDGLFAARSQGVINIATPLPDASNLIASDGRPKWRGSASMTWSDGPYQVGGFLQYIGPVKETGFVGVDGTPWRVEDRLTANLYGQVSFGKESGGVLNRTRLRLGVRNITNESPPITSEGYLGSLYNPYGRYFYASVRKSF
jgi:iron complex outermembrane recepter protein